MNIVSRIQTALIYPMARAIVEAQSQRQRLKTLGKRPIVLHEASYLGQPIMLLALYQKGQLRPDVVRLLEEAKAQGLYVIGVNTLKLHDPSAIRHLVDCYIEQPNFGRDFGSYKTGFQHVYARNWEATCPRLLMLNDSVYYSTRGLEKFISDLTTSEVEVLGATENYEIEYHLGSFCISLSSIVLRSGKLKKYWKNYRLTDVRPAVIKRGEMALSKVLKSCVSMPSQFGALYSSNRFLHEIKDNPQLQDSVIKDSRTSTHTTWPRFDIETVADQLSGRVIARNFSLDERADVSIETPIRDLNEEVLVTNREDLARYLLRHVSQPVRSFENILGDALSAVASEVFMVGSQIHQNAAILLEIGLPIIKLDGLYRGMFNSYDLLRLQKKLDTHESRELTRILMERPYGGQTFIGWKRAAFMRGLI